MKLTNLRLSAIVGLVFFVFASQAFASGKTEILTPPNSEEKWYLKVNVESMTLEGQKLIPENGIPETGLFYYDKGAGTGLSAFISRLNLKSASQCREHYYKLMKNANDPLVTNYKKTKYKKNFLIEKFVKGPEGMVINQKHVNAYFKKNGNCIDIHLSKTNYKPEDEKWFQSMIDSVKIVNGRPETKVSLPNPKTSLEYGLVGNDFFNKKDYANAIINYRKAVNLDKEKHDLDATSFVVIVDSLGMAYGITEDYARAITNYEYGISTYYDYPMFYYNLACTYGEKGNAVKANDNLSNAYFYRNNNLPGEMLPDPLTDPSFKNILDDYDFKKLAENIRAYRMAELEKTAK